MASQQVKINLASEFGNFASRPGGAARSSPGHTPQLNIPLPTQGGMRRKHKSPQHVPRQVEHDEEGDDGDGDVRHVDLLGVAVGPPLVEEHDPLADPHVQYHQDRDRCKSRRDEWVKLEEESR